MKPRRIYKIVIKRSFRTFNEQTFYTSDERAVELVQKFFKKKESQLKMDGVANVKYMEIEAPSHRDSGTLSGRPNTEPIISFLQGVLTIGEEETWSFRIFSVPLPGWETVSEALNKMFTDKVSKPIMDDLMVAEGEKQYKAIA